MTISTAVMLLRLHLIYNNLRPLKLIVQNLCFYGDTLKIRLANVEFAIVLECKNSAKVDLATGGNLR